MRFTIGRCFVGVLFSVLALGEVAAAVSDLRQGWTASDREWFYYTTQGSRLIRHSWFMALERPDSEELFLADGLARFGYLPGLPAKLNPDRLPVGFAIDRSSKEPWTGMTCAACHTSDITYRGATLRVDGAPTGAAMYEFLAELDKALQKAAGDDAAFKRFAAKVLGAQNTEANRTRLRDDKKTGLRKFSRDFTQFVIDSTPDSPWGPARLDAFGMIFNRVTAIGLNLPGNNQKPNAPVSYPFLWGTSYHDKTQWNGAVDNDSELERLGRNVGQVLGVFGTIDFTKPPLYPSSVNRVNLLGLERKVATLKAPVWPAALFTETETDRFKAARGAALFTAKGCSSCHQVVPRADQTREIEVKLTRVSVLNTDDAMTRMASTRTSATGILEGRWMVFPLRPIGERELAGDLLAHAVVRALVGPSDSMLGVGGTNLLKRFFNGSTSEMYYKARPLNGIWATAPYLHNGSVRTLYQLLLPAAQREPRFFVGTREFDPDDVGFANARGPVPFEFDTALPGNANTGHEYGTDLTEYQRRQLIAFMKTL